METCNDTVRVVKLLPIKASEIVSTTITADNYHPAWNSSTAYKRGDVVVYHNIEFVCQQDTSTNDKPLYMKPTSTANAGLIPTKVLVYHDGTNYQDYLPYNKDTNYAVGDSYFDPKQGNLVFKVLVAGVNKKPPRLSFSEMVLATDFVWAKLGEDNYLSWLNGRTAKQSLQGGVQMILVIQPARAFTTLDLFNLQGGNVSIVVTDESNNSAELFSETQAAREGSKGFWEYCFKQPKPKTSLHFEIGKSGYRNKKATITISGESEAGVGLVSLGNPTTIGRMSQGSYASAESQNPITQNPYGVTYMGSQQTAEMVDLPVMIKGSQFDVIYQTMKTSVGDPVVIYGDNTYKSLVSYGLLQRFKQTLTKGGWVKCEIKLEKLL